MTSGRIWQFLLNIVLGLFFVGASTPVGANILPMPKEFTQLSGSCSLGNVLSICMINDNSAENLYAAKLINQAFRDKFGISTYLQTDPRKADILLILVDSEQALKMGIPSKALRESYRLQIQSGKIRIEASDPRGIFYGAVSLVQYIQQFSEPLIDNLQILDWSETLVRGVSEDLSTGPLPTLDAFKKKIRYLAHYKMNTLFLGVSDAILSDKYSAVGSDRDVFSKGEMAELVRYAQKHFIDVIPVFPSLSRQNALLRRSSLESLAEFRGSGTFCTSCDLTYEFLEDTFVELDTLFPSGYLHIGGFRGAEMGFGRSESLLRSLGREKLYVQHFEKVYAICKKLGKRIILSGDLLQEFPEIAQIFPQDITYVLGTIPKAGEEERALPYEEIPPRTYQDLILNYGSTLFPQYRDMGKQANALLRDSAYLQKLDGIMANTWQAGLFSLFSYRYSYAQIAQLAWTRKKTNPDVFAQEYFKSLSSRAGKRLSQMYNRFDQVSNLISWKDFWRHPLFLRADSSSMIKQARSINALTEEMYAQLDSLDQYDELMAESEFLKLVTELYRYYSLKLQTEVKLLAWLRTGEVDKDFLLPLMEENENELRRLQKAMGRYWNNRYQARGFQDVVQQFERLIYYFQETKDAVLFNQADFDPYLRSQWIYDCPNILDTSECADKTTFRKDFFLDEIPQTAYFQVIAIRNARIQVNGEYIDELSYTPKPGSFDPQSGIRMYDIQKDLVLGSNTLLIEAENYYAPEQRAEDLPLPRGAGLNALIFMRIGIRERLIGTDKSWRVKYRPYDLEESWKPVLVKSFPFPITNANFRIERTSRIEY